MEDLSNIQLLIGLLISMSTLFGVLANFFNKVLANKLKPFHDNQRMQLRFELCSFAGDLRNGINKTREEFQAIFEMYDRYELLIEKLNLKNHYIDNEMLYITEQYKLLK